MAAAVADFRPAERTDRKLERGDGLTLELVPTADILAGIVREVAGRRRRVGPAGAASVRPARSWSASRPRRARWNAPRTSSPERAWTCSSRTTSSEPGSGFGTETNRVTILAADGTRDELPLLSKREVADRLLDKVVRALDARDAGAQTSRT